MKILAIETSCDETAAAVIEVQSKDKSYKVIKVNSKDTDNVITNNSILHTCILSSVVSSQIKLHQKFGGVFPEIASRAHTEKIIPVVERALKSAKDKSYKSYEVTKQNTNNFITYDSLLDDIDFIAVTTGPGLIGSLLVGVNSAKTYSYINNLPIIGINHLLGHIYSTFAEENSISNFQSSNKTERMSFCEMPVEERSVLPSIGDETKQEATSRVARVAESKTTSRGLPKFPALILIVSGGHTGLYLMQNHTEIKTLGETLDDAAGEAFDKVAKLLELGYPGGPAIAKAAAEFSISNFQFPIKSQIPNIKFPRSMLDRRDYNFSFSGLKTAVLYKVKELSKRYTLNAIRSQVAFEFQQAVIDILVGKTIQAAYKFKPKSICLCGGVAANQKLRQHLKLAVEKLPSKTSYHVPPMNLTTDNAAMIGLAAAYHLDQKTTWDKINAEANLGI